MADPHEKYWPYYCEENVWHLCEGLPNAEGEAEALVIFISNAARSVAVWNQRAADAPDEALLWDYHVILATRADATREWEIIDHDSLLPCPAPAETYLAESFPNLPDRWARHLPRFRVLPAALYRRELCTDRRHMRTDDGGWRSPPPPGPPLGEGSNLMDFVDMEAEFLGEIVDLRALKRRLAIG